MNSDEYKFYLYKGTSSKIYNGTLIFLIIFAILDLYLTKGINIGSILISIIFILLGSVLIYPLFKSKFPLYIVDSRGFTQNKYWFIPMHLSWADIRSISYPSEFIFSRKGSVTITRDSAMLTKKVTLGLSDLDKPYEFLKALNSFKPFGFDDLQAKRYFEKYHDREKMFYSLLLYLCIGVAIILMANYYMPYIILEDNKYSTLWGILFFFHLLSSIVISLLVHQDIIARKSFIKLAVVLWLFIFIGPFLIEQNAYYNIRALISMKRHDYPNAEKYIQTAIALHPKGYTYHETLGKILYEQKQYERSIDTFRFLLINDERLTDYYIAYYKMWIGKSLWQLERYSEAEDTFNEVRAINDDNFNREIKSLMSKRT